MSRRIHAHLKLGTFASPALTAADCAVPHQEGDNSRVGVILGCRCANFKIRAIGRKFPTTDGNVRGFKPDLKYGTCVLSRPLRPSPLFKITITREGSMVR